MARRPFQLIEEDDIPRPIKVHIAAMRFINLHAYLEWCLENGFEANINKSKSDLQEEHDAFEQREREIAKQSRLHKNPKVFLTALCQRKVHSDNLVRPAFKTVAEEVETHIKEPETRLAFLDMLLALLRHKDLIFETVPDDHFTPFIRGLIKLHDRKALWLRPLEEWKPKSKNPLRKFGELTHHLFDEFGDVPRFMEAVWLRVDRPSWRYRDWYVHLGRGNNLRKAKSPVPLTKKMAHYFLTAPDDYTAEQAIRWGQLKSLGLNTASIDAVAATRLSQSFENEPFWFSVFQFFSRSPMLDPRQIGPIIDYLQNQKYEGVRVEIAPGEFRAEPPPQPGLSMTGRDMATLLRQVDDWHIALGKQKALSTTAYNESKFAGYSVEKRKGDMIQRWVIRQLMSGRELQRESEALRHCVASYHWSCSQGQCTIWSLSSSMDGKTYNKHLTLEIDKTGTLVQARGLANRDPDATEWSVINAWAGRENIAIGLYL